MKKTITNIRLDIKPSYTSCELTYSDNTKILKNINLEELIRECGGEDIILNTGILPPGCIKYTTFQGTRRYVILEPPRKRLIKFSKICDFCCSTETEKDERCDKCQADEKTYREIEMNFPYILWDLSVKENKIFELKIYCTPTLDPIIHKTTLYAMYLTNVHIGYNTICFGGVKIDYVFSQKNAFFYPIYLNSIFFNSIFNNHIPELFNKVYKDIYEIEDNNGNYDPKLLYKVTTLENLIGENYE